MDRKPVTEATLGITPKGLLPIPILSLPVGIFQADPLGYCVQVNRAWSEITGLTADQALGTGWADALHPADRELVIRAWNHLVESGGLFQEEYRFHSADGTVKWVLGRAQALADADGQVLGYVGSITDISERKALEQKLRNQQDLLRRIVINMPTMLVAFGRDRHPVAWNRECERITGYTLTEIGNTQDVFQTLGATEEDRQRLLQDWYLSDCDFRDKLIRLRAKNGHDRFVSWSNLSRALPIPGWTSWGVGADVTELRTSRHELEVISEQLAERVKELHCLYAASSVLNRAPSNEVKAPLQAVADLIPSGFRFPERCRAKVTVPGAVFISGDFQPSGTVLQGTNVDSDGHASVLVETYYVEALPGERESVFLPEEQYLVDEIACRIGELLTRQESRKQLERAREQAEAGLRLRNELLANVSHELRTPMNSILGYSEVLLDGVDGPLNATQAESLRRVDRNARKLLRLINDLLDLSTGECGKFQLASDAFSIREMISDLVRNFREPAQRKGLRMEYRLDPEIPDFLVGDELRLRQVVSNLLDNAVKFTQQGGVSCLVGVTEILPKVVQLHIQIQDAGCGIPPPMQEMVFEPFIQADGTSTRNHEGSGLGLSISKHLVEQMGGTIHLESEVGRGSTFHVRLSLPYRH